MKASFSTPSYVQNEYADIFSKVHKLRHNKFNKYRFQLTTPKLNQNPRCSFSPHIMHAHRGSENYGLHCSGQVNKRLWDDQFAGNISDTCNMKCGRVKYSKDAWPNMD